MHDYSTRLIWDGNTGQGTASYASYGRQYRIVVPGKADLIGTADPAFRGAPDKHNPEELFIAAIAACHMLFYLSLCARQGVRVLAYEDETTGRMIVRPDGGGMFEEVTLQPRVTVSREADTALALQLHQRAHELCFIANSCRVPIRYQPAVRCD